MAHGKNILVIDDDEKLNTLLQDYLSKFGFRVCTVIHPEQGFKQIRKTPPDLIVLDIMLPDMDGFHVCKEIRKEYQIPIIMLTARGEVTDRIVGLELGADDYLPKPFEPRELVARIQSILRRSDQKQRSKRFQFGELIIEEEKQQLFLKGKRIELTTAEFTILMLLIKNSGKVMHRDRIIEIVRGLEWDAFDRSIDVLVSRIRQKLGDDAKQPRFIRTVWGKGYQFIGDK